MGSIIEKSFSINLKLMRVLHLYPPEEATFLFKIRAYIVYLVLALPVPLLGIVHYCFEIDSILKQLDDNAFVIAQMTCQVIKFLPFITNSIKIKKCIRFLNASQFTPQCSKQKAIIDNCCRICARNSRIFVIAIVVGIIFLTIFPILGKEQKLPLDIWMPFDIKSDFEIFFYVYIFVTSGIAYAALACAAIDPLIAGLAYSAVGQLQVLKDNLQYFSEYTKEHTEKNQKEKKLIINDFIQECVDHHNSILEFINYYQESFSMSVFTQFMGSIVVICFGCLQLNNLDPLSFFFFSMLTYVLLVLSQIYLYCYYGTLLFEEVCASLSNSIRNSFYMGKWYDLDIKTKKSLMILMERSKRPIKIYAGKIFEISVETFTTILRRSYSLLAVIKNV